MGNCCSNDKDIKSVTNENLKNEIKNLQKKIDDHKIETTDYDTRSEDIQKNLKSNINKLSAVNKELEEQNGMMQDKLNKLTDNQRRGCRHVKCLNLEIEKNRILRENEDLRNLLLKAETAEKSLKKMRNDENRCMKKIKRLQKFMEQDNKLIIELSNKKRFLQTRINLLNEELMDSKSSTEKQEKCAKEIKSLEKEMNMVDVVFHPRKTIEEQFIFVKGHIKDLEDHKMKIEQQSKETKKMLKLGRRESFFERKIKNGKSIS